IGEHRRRRGSVRWKHGKQKTTASAWYNGRKLTEVSGKVFGFGGECGGNYSVSIVPHLGAKSQIF
ncbi:MAG: hypothetical protein V1696_02835, partial [Candidatus Jorgensenbacteria bacterium]